MFKTILNFIFSKTSYLVILTALLSSNCNQSKLESSDHFERLFSGDMEVIDLTYTVGNSSPYWPSKRGNPFIYDTLFAHKSGAPGMGSYSVPEHFGTHLDAPIHSADSMKSVDQLTSTELFGPAAVIDVSTICATDPDYQLKKVDILAWEKLYGILPKGAIILMYTGWSKKWPDRKAYLNLDEGGQMHFPGFSPEAAKFLIEERQINGIGIDNLSVDVAIAKGFPVHGIVNGAGKVQLENVANMHLLPLSGAYLILAPIKLEGGSGGQVRIFAVIP